MRVIQWHASRLFTLLPVDAVNSIQTLKASSANAIAPVAIIAVILVVALVLLAFKKRQREERDITDEKDEVVIDHAVESMVSERRRRSDALDMSRGQKEMQVQVQCSLYFFGGSYTRGYAIGCVSYNC